jgi:hypothetical protein
MEEKAALNKASIWENSRRSLPQNVKTSNETDFSQTAVEDKDRRVGVFLARYLRRNLVPGDRHA